MTGKEQCDLMIGQMESTLASQELGDAKAAAFSFLDYIRGFEFGHPFEVASKVIKLYEIIDDHPETSTLIESNYLGYYALYRAMSSELAKYSADSFATS